MLQPLPHNSLPLATRLRLSSRLPYRLVDMTPYVVERFPVPDRFTAPNPPTAGAHNGWTRSVPARILFAYIVRIPQGMATQRGYVTDGEGRLLDWATHKAPHRSRGVLGFALTPGKLKEAIQTAPITCFDQEAAVLTASFDWMYFHWLYDVLPRLFFLEQCGLQDRPLYINSKLPFQRETLEMLGYRNLIHAGAVPVLRAPSLVVPCHQFPLGHALQPWVVTFLRERLGGQPLIPPASSKRRRLFLSRAKAARRHLLNESEILDLLTPLGFEVVYPEDLTVKQQIALFQSAEVVVGQTGGALTNIVFCPKGAAVISLDPYYSEDVFYRLALSIGLNFFFLSAPRPDNRKNLFSDYEAPKEALQKICQWIGL